MAQENKPLPNQEPEQPVLSNRDTPRLQVTAYDRSSSLLIALLILVGAAVAGVTTYYLTLSNDELAVSSVDLSPVGTKDLQEGTDVNPEPPGVENAPELDKPQISAALTSLTLTSEKSAAIADSESKEQGKTSAGQGPGDKRTVGRDGPNRTEREPREERWKIKYVDVEIKEYKRQLDFFNIELGVIDRKKNAIHWAKNFSTAPKTGIWTGEETRKRRLLAFSFQAGSLRQRDQQLIVKAGVLVKGPVVQFFPRMLEEELAFKELEKAGTGRTVNDIYRTHFEVRRKGNGYEIFVADQKYF